jgi:hypothetical protein
MALSLNQEMLRSAYDYLNSTPPFRDWNLPEGDDVIFRVIRDRRFRGWYERDTKKNTHTIAVSVTVIGHTLSLMMVMAHEMVHLHEEHANACGRGQHSAAFNRWMREVCAHHGFDPRLT